MNKLYEIIINDLQETNKRLNEELNHRVAYEHKLIELIEQKQQEINTLKNFQNDSKEL